MSVILLLSFRKSLSSCSFDKINESRIMLSNKEKVPGGTTFA